MKEFKQTNGENTMKQSEQTDERVGQLEQTNKELRQLKERMGAERPISWPEFPEIKLYKDQILSYMERQLINFDDNSQITSAMLNNYIKDKLLPSADGKKYLREHLAGFTEICVLKQVLTVRDTGLLLQQELEGSSHETFYEKFRGILDVALARTSERIEQNLEFEALSDMALRLAVSSYCDKLAAERMLEIIRVRVAALEQKKAEKKKPEKPKKAKKPEKPEKPEKSKKQPKKQSKKQQKKPKEQEKIQLKKPEKEIIK